METLLPLLEWRKFAEENGQESPTWGFRLVELTCIGIWETDFGGSYKPFWTASKP